jgi:aspartyl-tRNA(Asn)/glutamyl-tRNA(Gln) amidotransferase subunit A
MAPSVRDVALLLGVIAGPDPLDATASARPPEDWAGALGEDLRGLRIGVPENYFWTDLHDEMAAGVRAALRTLEDLGAGVRAVRVPDPQVLSDAGNIVARAESAAAHARLLRERPHEIQPAVRHRLEVGSRITAHDYVQALRLRARLARAFIREVFAEVDALVAPVIPEPAPALADLLAGGPSDLAERMRRFARLTRPVNALGLPALAVPCGFSSLGLPLAFQAVGRPFDEATVLRIGHAYEQAAGWAQHRPALG